MKLKTFMIFFSMTITLVNGFGQNNYHFGLKAGFSISKFPKKSKGYYGGREYSGKGNPLYSPVIGLEIYSPLVDHFNLLLGIEYQMTGTRDSGTETSLLPSYPYQASFIDNKTFHKICVPVSTGINLKIKNNESSIRIGLRPDFFITGRYYYKHCVQRTDTSFVTVDTHNPFNPKEDYFKPLKRFVVQFSIILSENISEHLKANLSLNFGKSLRPYYNEFKNNDFSLSITYLFNSASK